MQAATSEDRADRDEAHAATEALARSVIEEAARLGLQPDPEVFARLWRRLGGPSDDAGREARAEAATVEPGVVADAAPPAPAPALDPGDEALLRYGDLLGGELGAVIDVLERRSAADGEFMARLDRTRESLPSFARPSTVRNAVANLRETAADHALRLSAFAEALRGAQTQIAELRVELNVARETAARDALTGLANRGRFDATLADLAERGAAFALVLADLDHFKRVNDAHGHPAGDAILRHFADILRRSLRTGDLAARFGGEEFAMILPGLGAAGARQVAERIRQEFGARSFRATDTGVRIGTVTASFGLAAHDGPGLASEVLARADAALYRAKRNGRNRVATAE